MNATHEEPDLPSENEPNTVPVSSDDASPLDVAADDGVEAEAAHLHVEDITPADAILSRAVDLSIDLIVMGGRTQKRDSMAEALLGSVSTAVLRYANCPVLVVP